MEKNELLKKLTNVEPEVYHVEAWDADVKLRPITIDEFAKTHKTMLADGHENMTLDQLLGIQIETVSIAMVDPKVTAKELSGIDVNKIAGMTEIYEHIIAMGDFQRHFQK
ncbi:hypothetical protein [Hydrogenimonas urashimensis]|uniref:hypothetical protein n=1 Tax=Hydrogenimonas urashimensis TaxID=2740515 RepID=UPI0019153EFE|nr:hypothetical protein [Hydrogenimonas urashimensis]